MNNQWQSIETAPDPLDRVLVCGWHKPHGRTPGYWWWGVDRVLDGKACEHPGALYWAPVILPLFPPAIVDGSPQGRDGVARLDAKHDSDGAGTAIAQEPSA